LRVESERVGNVAAGFADGAVVVNDEEVEEIGSLDLGGMFGRAGEEGGVGGGGHGESPLERLTQRADFQSFQKGSRSVFPKMKRTGPDMGKV
jgi:hypothetical protein